MTATYTVLHADGDIVRRGLSLEAAADALLSADGRVYSIEFLHGAFEIRRSQFSQNANGGAGPLRPVQANGRFLHPTLRALYTAVVSDEWNGLYAIPDAEYDARAAAETDEDPDA